MDLAGDRHLDVEAICQSEGSVDRVGALGHTAHRPFDLVPVPALRQLLAEPVVARQARTARRDDIADPREAGKGQRVGAGRQTEAHHLGEPAGDEPSLAVVPEAQAVGSAGGNRDDVLERTAQLDAEDVGVDVQPELPSAQPLLNPGGQLQVLGGNDG